MFSLRSLLRATLCAVGLGPAVADASPADPAPPRQNPREQLLWASPVGCPDVATAATQIDGLLGKPLAEQPNVAVEGRIAVNDAGYVLHLTVSVDGQVESRRVESTDCGLLTRTAALLVAVTVDAVATALLVEDSSEPSPDSGPLPPPLAEPVLSLPLAEPVLLPPLVAPHPPPSARTPLNWRHGYDIATPGGIGIGIAPGVTGGFEASAGWRYGPLRLRALGYHWFGREEPVDQTAGVVVSVSGGGLRGCYAFAAPKFEVPLCIGPDLAAWRGRGVGASVTSRNTTDAWAALVMGAGFELLLGPRFSLHTRFELLVALRQPAVHLDRAVGPIEVFRAPAASFRLLLGPMFHSR